jgi:hypothetical protein
MDIHKLINEVSRVRGSHSGSKAIQSKSQKVSSKKSRVFVYKSIMDALKRGKMGQIFSTKKANRLYVITKRKWGQDPEQMYQGRVAKGFSPGSIPSDFSAVKTYAQRTMVRHQSGKKPTKEIR